VENIFMENIKLRKIGSCRTALLASLFGLLSPAAHSQTPPPVTAHLGKAADNHIHAQAVLNAVMAANPDLVAIGLHAVPPGIDAPPGSPDSQIIAQSADEIGRKDAPIDLEPVKHDQILIYLAPLAGIPRMKVMVPLRDASQRIIGLAVLSFRPSPGMDKMKAHIRTDEILATFARNFPDKASLFLPESR
jgi:hypothetical protein